MTALGKPAEVIGGQSLNTELATRSQNITQRSQILERLRREGVVCGASLLRDDYIARYAAVIHRLRDEGWPIGSRVCKNPAHRHHAQSRVAEYFLEVQP